MIQYYVDWLDKTGQQKTPVKFASVSLDYGKHKVKHYAVLCMN